MNTNNKDAETPEPEKNQPDSIDAQAERAAENTGNNARASWTVSADNLRKHIAHMSAEAKELIIWCFNWCIDPAHPLKLKEFADRVGFDPNTIYKIITARYIHPTTRKPLDISSNLLKELRNFRRLEISRAKLGRKAFILTPTAKTIFTYCDLARESQTPVFFFGASHIGKTEAFKQYCVDNNHGRTRLIEIKNIGGKHGLIKQVAVALGISPNSYAGRINERIEAALTPDMVLIFDDLHKLELTYRKETYFDCIEWIRGLYDTAHCGIVLSFTNLGFSKAEKERKRELEQIFRRGVHRKNLGIRPSIYDVKAIVKHFGLEFPSRNEPVDIKVGAITISEKPYALLEQLATEQGFKAIIERIRYAIKLGTDLEQELSWELFINAHLTIERGSQPPEDGWNLP